MSSSTFAIDNDLRNSDIVELFKNDEFASDSASKLSFNTTDAEKRNHSSTESKEEMPEQHSSHSCHKQLHNICKELESAETNDIVYLKKTMWKSTRNKENALNTAWTRYAQVHQDDSGTHTSPGCSSSTKMEGKYELEEKSMGVMSEKNTEKAKDMRDESFYCTAQNVSFLVDNEECALETKIELEESEAPEMVEQKIDENIQKRISPPPNATKAKNGFLKKYILLTSFALLGSLSYPAYILWLDVTKEPSEEQRYLAKMQTAGLVFKCYYFLQRQLNLAKF